MVLWPPTPPNRIAPRAPGGNEPGLGSVRSRLPKLLPATAHPVWCCQRNPTFKVRRDVTLKSSLMYALVIHVAILVGTLLKMLQLPTSPSKKSANGMPAPLFPPFRGSGEVPLLVPIPLNVKSP